MAVKVALGVLTTPIPLMDRPPGLARRMTRLRNIWGSILVAKEWLRFDARAHAVRAYQQISAGVDWPRESERTCVCLAAIAGLVELNDPAF
jgi:hypothetical protein